MKIFRIALSLGLAAVATGGLLYLMLTLIETGDANIDDKPARKLADIYMPEREIETKVKEEKAEKPDEPDEPPPDFEPPQVDNFDASPEAVDMTPVTGLDLNITIGTGIGSADGEYLPIVKVAPVYPRRANSRGIEGYCTVEYTVTTSGAIRNPTPVDCKPAGVFEKTSVKAALKFKYKPRVVDGQPIEVAGVRNRFTFRLEK
ncbi:MAG: energy transducer TonB [Endozoicomonas sp.]